MARQIPSRMTNTRTKKGRSAMRRYIFYAGLAIASAMAPATAQQAVPPQRPFTATLSNNTPLAFGMDAADTARALQTPLTYVRGRPGDEIFLAIRSNGGSGFFERRNRLFLQFRRGRLSGWKGDWGSDWLWQ
jgi:hypothetical protein